MSTSAAANNRPGRTRLIRLGIESSAPTVAPENTAVTTPPSAKLPDADWATSGATVISAGTLRKVQTAGNSVRSTGSLFTRDVQRAPREIHWGQPEPRLEAHAQELHVHLEVVVEQCRRGQGAGVAGHVAGPPRRVSDGRFDLSLPHGPLQWRAMAAPDGFAALEGARYVLLTSYRRSGAGVPTPFGALFREGKVYCFIDARSGKVKRIRRQPRVEVAPCTQRGAPTGPSVAGQARVLEGAEADELAAAFDDLRRRQWGSSGGSAA